MVMFLNKVRNKINKKIIIFILLMLIGLFYSAWLFGPNLLAGHDIDFHLSRIIGLNSSLKAHDILAYIHKGLYGLGYANGLFYSNLFIYLPSIAYNFFSLLNSYKLFICLNTVTCVFLMYLCIKNITESKKVAILTAFIYTGCSYRICDVISRAAVGEILAFTFLPLVIWGFYEILYKDVKKWWIFSIGFVLLIHSHLISALLIFINLVIILIFNFPKLWNEKVRIKYFLISAIVGLLLGASFIFPLLEGNIKNNLIVGDTIYSTWNYTLPFERLFLGIPYFKNKGFMPAGVGILFIVLIIIRFCNKLPKNNITKFADTCIIVGFANLICITCLFPWEEISSKFSLIQFPWRLYLISSIMFTVASGVILKYLLFEKTRNSLDKYFKVFLIILSASIPYISTWYIDSHTNAIKKINNYNGYAVSGGEYLPKGTNLDELVGRVGIITSNNPAVIVTYEQNSNCLIVDYKNNNRNNTYIEVPLVYYYGYNAVSLNNNKSYNLEVGKNGIIKMKVNKKADKIKIYYKYTTIQIGSTILSGVSFIILFIYLYLSHKKKVG